jgi:DNA recombination protein RmuC
MMAAMDSVMIFVLGCAVGLGLWLWQRGLWMARVADLQAQLSAQLVAREVADGQLSQAFKGLAADALNANTQAFLNLAEQRLAAQQGVAQADLGARQQAVEALVKPLQETLAKLETQAHGMETTRTAAYAGLTEQVKSLLLSQQSLHSETRQLVTALRRPEGRGRWGELQLRRVAELAGMVAHCDFYEQEANEGGDGKKQRPDMVVRLPGGKTVVVDAKVPLVALLDGVDSDASGVAETTQQGQRLAQHVKDHIKKLSDKAYWAQFPNAPEFVVLFLPGESFFSLALQHDPALIEFAAERQVILATPTTLLALLKAVYYGWRQETLAENAQQISKLGADLYQRLSKLGEHWTSVGKHLGGAVKAYNEATASLESRVMVSARRFGEIQVAANEVAALTQVEQQPRVLQSIELQEFQATKGETP